MSWGDVGRCDGPGVPSPDDPLAEANVTEARQVIERLPTLTALWMRDYLGRLQHELWHRRRWECTSRTTLPYFPLTYDEIDALLDMVDAARAVVRSESVGQPSVDRRALTRLRDAIGRLEG